MPILEIEVVGDAALAKGLAAQLADAAAEVLDASGRTWVRLRQLAEDRYAEDGGGPPEDVRPVFVKVLKARRPEPEQLRDEIRLLTEALARCLERPAENVHVLYEDGATGRLAFGGKLVEAPRSP